MAEITLTADHRDLTGNGPARRLRAEGKVPGVVYGLGGDPIPVTVEWRPLRDALTTEAGLNALINLEVDGRSDLTIVKELQRHPIRGDVLHVDFIRVDADAAITVDVPVQLVGEPLKVLQETGTVDHILFSLSVNAKPSDIPNELVVDISDMEIGDTIRVSDLPLPAGVTTDIDGEEPVASAQVSSAALEAEAIAEADAELAAEQAEESEEGEAPAEGEATEGEAEGAEDGDDAGGSEGGDED